MTPACPRNRGFACPLALACLGRSDPRACDFVARQAAWRALSTEQQLAAINGRAWRVRTWIGKARDFARACWLWARAGFPVVDAQVEATRKAACRACPHHDPARDGCRKCGCGMDRAMVAVGLTLRLKRRWATQACADDRWGPEPGHRVIPAWVRDRP